MKKSRIYKTNNAYHMQDIYGITSKYDARDDAIL